MQKGSHRKGKIEGIEEHAIHAKPLARDALAGRCRGRNHEQIVGQSFFQLRHETSGGNHLAH